MTELARGAHLIGESEAVDPPFLRRAPLATPYEGPLPYDSLDVGLDEATEIRAPRISFDAHALEPHSRLHIEQLRQHAEDFDLGGEAGSLDQRRLAMRAILPHGGLEFVGRA